MDASSKEAARKIAITTPSDAEIRTARIFDAPLDRLWRAYTERDLIGRWFGRGNKVDVEVFEPRQGGRWRLVEHSPEGTEGFEGIYREVTPHQRIVETFGWDGMPGYISLETAEFADIGDGRTRIVTTSRFFTRDERDGMLNSGMEQGMAQSYAALDRLLEEMG